MLSYPKSKTNEKNIFVGNNYITTYNTFEYIFDVLKKGVYIAIKDNKLDVYLPFNNINYVNNWSKILKKSNPKMIKKLSSESKNISDPSKWYANNCIFSYGAMKYKYKEYIEEGDKTIVPFKHFLLGFIKYLKETNKKVDDIEFFFNPRDFPVLRKDHKEPYDQIFKNEKIDKKYQHEVYTPILSQSGNKDFEDIPIPTEDDMMRIVDKIYPDTCKNNYNKDHKFELDFDKKKPICVFRGSATGCGIDTKTNMRLKAAQMSYDLLQKGKNILDAKLTGWNNKPKIYDGNLDILDRKKFKFTAGKENFMDLEEQSRHKYILDIDGHVKAFRLGNEFRMGSVVLLVDSPYTLWFQKYLEEYTHYVPIKSDLSDLENQIEWCIKNDDKCKKIAKNGLEFYEKYLSYNGTYSYFYNLISKLGSYRIKPEFKMSEYEINIVVAYRDPGDGSRKTQLEIFVDQMNIIFKDRAKTNIYIIEQESDRNDYDDLPELFQQPNSRMAKFNLGMLKNIGFTIANKKDKDNSYTILTDVDLLPSKNLVETYLSYPENVIHLANKGTRYNKDGKNKSFLGGAISVNSEDFKKCNGYPNNFWGWGGEDDALYHRLEENKIKIDRGEYPVIDLEDYSLEEKLDILRSKQLKEMRKVEKVKDDKKDWKNNGLSNLEDKYKIINKSKYNNIDNTEHIKVELFV